MPLVIGTLEASDSDEGPYGQVRDYLLANLDLVLIMLIVHSGNLQVASRGWRRRLIYSGHRQWSSGC